jgi:hypothetical protein
MILTSNRGFSEWGHVFGDPVVATALLDRLLHHAATVIQIEAASYRLREHADLVPENIREKSHPTVADPANSQTSRPAGHELSINITRRSPCPPGEFYAIIGEIPRAIDRCRWNYIKPQTGNAE